MHLAHRFQTLPCSSLLRIFILFMALAPTSMVWALAPEVSRMRSSMPFCQIFSFRNTDRANSCYHDLDVPYGFTYHENTWILRPGLQRSNRTSVPFSARLCKVETYAASASNVSGSARSWLSLEQVDGSTAAGSHGPGSSSDNRNTRRRLDISPNPDDEHARSAVLLRFPCEQYHKGITKWINNLCEESNMPAFGSRSICQDFVARSKDDGLTYDIDSPFCNVSTHKHSRPVQVS